MAATALAESDPWYGYGYGYGLAHPYTLGYGCHNAYGAPVPCAGRKKREADPAVLLHHPYAYGAYGYGIPAVGAAVAVKPCTNVDGEKVNSFLLIIMFSRTRLILSILSSNRKSLAVNFELIH